MSQNLKTSAALISHFEFPTLINNASPLDDIFLQTVFFSVHPNSDGTAFCFRFMIYVFTIPVCGNIVKKKIALNKQLDQVQMAMLSLYFRIFETKNTFNSVAIDAYTSSLQVNDLIAQANFVTVLNSTQVRFSFHTKYMEKVNR